MSEVQCSLCSIKKPRGMGLKTTAFFFVAAIILHKSVADEAADTCSHYHFQYTSQYDWQNKCPDCGGYAQSPIDIAYVSRTTPGLGPLGFRGWCQSLAGDWTNNGHTLKFIPLNNQPQVNLDSYGQYGFVFKQFHLHWGINRGQGSEHTINRYSYDGEMHFVFTGSINGMKRYTVLALFLKSDPYMYNIPHKWAQFNRYVRYNEKISVYNVVLSDFLPENKDYYIYHGSLTTPPCTEAAQWIILTHPIVLPDAFFTMLRNTPADNYGNKIAFNHRSTQNINGRIVQGCYGAC